MFTERFSTFSSRAVFSLLVLLFGGLVVPSSYAQSEGEPDGTITVRIVGLDNSDGAVRAELTTAQNYEGEGNVRAESLPIQDKKAQWTIKNVPAGTYALRLYHDANGNGELDTNMFGVPQEAFGFSNDARGNLGPPAFEDASFTVTSGSRSMTITLK